MTLFLIYDILTKETTPTNVSNTNIPLFVDVVKHNFEKGGAGMQGYEIKEFIQRNDVKLWQVAERLGMSDGNFSRRLRKPFSKAEFRRIEEIVEKILAEQE